MMPEGTPSAFEEFGDTWTGETDPLVDLEPEAPTAQPGTTEPPASEPPPVEGAQPPEGEAETPKLYAGKYGTPEELERAYGEAQTLIHRQGEERNRALMEAAQVRETARQLLPLVQAQLAQQQAGQVPPPPKPSAEQLAQIGLDEDGYKALEPIVQQQVAAQVAAQVAPVRAQFEAERRMAAQQQAETATRMERKAEIDSFRSAHADLTPEIEQRVHDTFLRINEAWRAQGWEMPVTADTLEVANEAAARPALANVLSMFPQLVDSEENLAYARTLASVMEAAQPGTPAPGRQATAPTPASGVITGGTGAPSTPPGTRRGDEFDEVIALGREQAASAFMR